MLTNSELEQIRARANEALAIWNRSGAEFAKQIQQALEPYNAFIKELQQHASVAVEALRKISDQISPALREFAIALQKLPPGIQRSTALLATRGWYISFEVEFPDMMRLADLVDEQSFDAVDLELSEFFRSRVEEIGNSLCSQYPHRQHILKAAFGAHDRGDYAVSVPLFLIQADGICYEMLGVQLYKKRSGIPATADVIDIQALDPFTAAVLEPLRILLPLAEDTVKIQNLDSAFNRHAIIHGLATQYGTEINSLKSISLLDYLLFVYRRAIEDDDSLAGS